MAYHLDETTETLSRISIAMLLENHNFTLAEKSAVNTLVDVFAKYMHSLCKNVKRNAEIGLFVLRSSLFRDFSWAH
jgi:hypothetical protein